MTSEWLLFLSFDPSLLLQVLSFNVHDFDVFATVSKAAPDQKPVTRRFPTHARALGLSVSHGNFILLSLSRREIDICLGG